MCENTYTYIHVHVSYLLSPLNTIDLKYYYVCCHDGTPTQKYHTTFSKPCVKKQSWKISDTCISRMYATRRVSGAVQVKYISSHTNHDLSVEQTKHLPLLNDVKSTISIIKHGDTCRMHSGWYVHVNDQVHCFVYL